MSLLRPAILTGSDLKLAQAFTGQVAGVITPAGDVARTKLPGGSEPAWGDGVPFMERTPSNPIHLNGQSGTVSNPIVISGLEFADIPYGYNGNNNHVCIRLTNCTNVVIRYCDFDTVGQPMAIYGGSNITIEWCRARNITGPSARHNVQTGNFIQTVQAPTNITIQDNKIVGGDTEDIISLFSARDSMVRRNHIEGARADVIGGGWISNSGTGIILGDGGGANCQALDNILFKPGQVGIAVAGGTNMAVRRNKILQLSQSPRASSNVGAYSLNYYGQPFGGHQFTDNRVRFWSDSQSVWNGFYGPSGVAVNTGNNWSDASLANEDLSVVL